MQKREKQRRRENKMGKKHSENKIGIEEERLHLFHTVDHRRECLITGITIIGYSFPFYYIPCCLLIWICPEIHNDFEMCSECCLEYIILLHSNLEKILDPCSSSRSFSMTDKVKLEDFGLSTDLVFFKDGRALKGNPTIIYTNVYNCNNFSMCIFFLPPAAIIPLHNHPGMTVFSKLLLGSMHVKSYDWIETSDSNKRPPSAKFKLAKLVVDSDFTASCKTSILYPTTGGNIHTFRAITSCVLLDILGPPYSKKDDRDCAYYKDHPYFHVADGNPESGGGDGCIGWLEEIDFPEYLKMEGIEYLGPQIVDD